MTKLHNSMLSMTILQICAKKK